MKTCDNQNWCRSILTNLGRMSFETLFEDGHTIDVGAWVADDCAVRGVVFEEFAALRIDESRYGLLHVLGGTQSELSFAVKWGVQALVDKLKEAAIYPTTSPNRTLSVIGAS